MQDIQAQVIAVEGIPTRKDPSKVRYVVKFGNGIEASCFEVGPAQKAQMSLGQIVDARVDQNGKYTNLIDVAPAGQLPPLALAAGTVLTGQIVPTGQITPAAQVAIPITTPTDFNRQTNPVDAERMGTYSAFSTAFGFIGNLYAGAGPEALLEAQEAALALARDLFTKAQGEAQPAVVAAPVVANQAAPVTPAQVVAEVNAVMGAEVVKSGPSW